MNTNPSLKKPTYSRMPRKKSTKKKSAPSRLIPRMWKLAGLFFLLFVLFIISLKIGLLGDMPDIEELENPKTKLASEIYSADGKQLGKFYYDEDRTNVEYADLPASMIDALIATEDARFYRHAGIDLRSLARAIVFLGNKGGASTITQQLAKNLFHPKKRNLAERILQKFKEWIIAVELERRYTKQEIILMYFNTVPWGNSYGIKSASKRFFNKPTQDLKIEEGAMLVGMLKASGTYNPVNNYDNAFNRRNTVLNQMHKYGYLAEDKCDSLKQLDIVLDYTVVSHNQGLATYFREHLRNYMKTWCNENGYNLYSDGLKIYTTIDSRLQLYAEQAVLNHMELLQKEFFKEYARLKQDPWRDEENPWMVDKTYIDKHLKRTNTYKRLRKRLGADQHDAIVKEMSKKHKMRIYTWKGEVDTFMSAIDSLKYYKSMLHAGFMSMDPHTGHIKAWVGGINHKYFQYDHVNATANRQVGSTFKPLVYARALDDELIQPCDRVATGPVTLETDDGKTWTPKNSGELKDDEMTLYKGLQQSVNTVTARVMKKLGPRSPYAVQELAGRMGIDTKKFVPYPSICLGVMDLSVFEMVGAYSCFANNGTWTEPIFITKIEDKHGNLLVEFVPEQHEAMREQTAYTMVKMLEKVATPPGTAGRLRFRYNIGYDKAIGGKTGTTQNNSDGWFMGITPDLVSGCWVGAEDRQVHFRSMRMGQGASMALPIFAAYMNKVYANPPYEMNFTEWKEPEMELSIELDCNEYNPGDAWEEDEEIDIPGIDF
jgi:penicillin-binding protein 1A